MNELFIACRRGISENQTLKNSADSLCGGCDLMDSICFERPHELFLSSVPMIAFFWMLSVCIQTPIFSVGIGLVSVVPSVLVINTKMWFAYPMSYPFFIITSEYGKLAANIDTQQVELIPWILVAVAIAILCLSISCLRFGQAERR